MTQPFNKGVSFAVSCIAALCIIISGCKKNEIISPSNEILANYPTHQKTAQEESTLIEFSKSTDFEREFIQGSQQFSGKEFNMPSSYVTYYTSINNVQIPIMYLAIESNNRVVGFVIGMKMPDSFHELKDDSRYMMSYRDYSSYDLQTKTGKIIDYDLNNDYVIGELVAEKGSALSWNSFENPATKSIRKEVNGLTKGQAACDTDHDGNIGFGECYKCMKDSCNTDGTCMALCDLLGFGAYCSGTIGAACIYISIAY